MHVGAHSPFTESCTCKCKGKLWPLFYFNTFIFLSAMSLVKTVFLQWANFLLCFFSLIIELTVIGTLVGIFLLLRPVPSPKDQRHRAWECPARLIPTWQSLWINKTVSTGAMWRSLVPIRKGEKQRNGCFLHKNDLPGSPGRKITSEICSYEATHSCKVTMLFLAQTTVYI